MPDFRHMNAHDLIAAAEGLEAEVAQLRLSVVGRDKALALLNAGMESACEQQHQLKQKVREQGAELAALRGENARLRALKAEADAALAGEIPAGLRFTMETEAAKIVERLQGPKEAGQ